MQTFILPIILSAILLASSNVSWAQSSSSLIERNPKYQYNNIKKAVLDRIKTSGQGLYFQSGEKDLDLYYCSDYSDMGLPIGKENKQISHLSSVAYDISLYEVSLTSVGYPRSVWGQFLQEREQAGISGRNLRFHDNSGNSAREKRDLLRLASILNSYRDDGHRKLPKIVVDGGCGAGGTTVSFQTNPPGGRILLVPKMFYSLCRIQGIDPNDEKKCDFWREVFKGQEPEVSGDYFVKIFWGDRSVVRNFSASKLEDGSNKVTLQ